uniref:DnaJ homolog subfamily C member 17 n=1 Tax=Phallusia mammillata TaxID=59560 RepID=A0A6F9DAL5_9ASCI|nr:dnaJ homolog subfamily C member 17 [Phallusia mammillata]
MPPTNQKKDDLMKLDLYKLLNINEDATQKQVKKAYRKKALECHPDKNPDNPKAAALFHQLSEALKILSDVGARAAYDHVRKAKKAAQERTDKLDVKRKKVKLDLEAREQAAEAAAKQQDKKQAKNTLKQEIERLRDEGSRILEEEQIKMRDQLKKERLAAQANLMRKSEAARLKLKWKAKKDTDENGGYSRDILMKMFSKYCDVTALILSKKPGGAIIEMENSKAAKLALSAELGLTSNPLRITWLSGDLGDETAPSNSDEDTNSRTQGGGKESDPVVQVEKSSSIAPPADTDDFESAVLLRMKMAQEKKRKLNTGES